MYIYIPGGSAVWPQCWLCAVRAVGRIGCCVGEGYPVGVSISSFIRASRPGRFTSILHSSTAGSLE